MDNFAQTDGGAMFVESSNPEFHHCIIDSNRSTRGYGGAAYLSMADVIFDSCDISHNASYGKGGGIYISSCNPVITFCTICDDSAFDYSGYGGAMYIHGTAEPIIENCTFTRNYSELVGGTLYLHSASSPQIKNCIIDNTLHGGGVFIFASYNASFTYIDFHNNSGGNFPNVTPPGVGTLTTVNANGDSCDMYYNIFLDPLLVDPLNSDFSLQENSPCIDAGDPLSPLDPDSTITDIGALYFNQGPGAPMIVSLAPHNPPIQIPPGGGSFQFDLYIENTTVSPINFDFWIEATLPNSNIYPVLLRPNLTIPAGGSVTRPDLSQNIPAAAPPGTYAYTAKAGIHPDSVIASDSFQFEKLAGGVDIGTTDDWKISGWDYGEALTQKPDDFNLFTVYPNPFNPLAELKFNLNAAGEVSLLICDVSGREVIRLVNEYLSPGEHCFTLDASDFASGIYFARLRTGKSIAVKKLILMK